VAMDSEVLLRFQEAENVEDLRKLYSKLAVPQIRPKLCFLTYLVILPLYICFGGLVFWATDFRSSQKAQLRFDQFCFEEKYAIITLLKEHSDSVYNIFNYSRQKIDAIVNAIDKMEICHRKGVSDFRPKTFDPYNSIIFSYSVLTSTGYGDVHPFTVTGQILTIIYAVFGIPLNIAFTADFGELITKAISAITEYFRLLCNKGDQRYLRTIQQNWKLMNPTVGFFRFYSSHSNQLCRHYISTLDVLKLYLFLTLQISLELSQIKVLKLHVADIYAKYMPCNAKINCCLKFHLISSGGRRCRYYRWMLR
uniref:Potassium channel domain-containing protein n=1 Tax=Parascaris univalens TaxID=6257 RepID=A0A915A6M0_PARUN